MATNETVFWLYEITYALVIALFSVTWWAYRSMRKWDRCNNCDGTGIDPLEPEHGCNACDGTGYYSATNQQ